MLDSLRNRIVLASVLLFAIYAIVIIAGISSLNRSRQPALQIQLFDSPIRDGQTINVGYLEVHMAATRRKELVLPPFRALLVSPQTSIWLPVQLRTENTGLRQPADNKQTGTADPHQQEAPAALTDEGRQRWPIRISLPPGILNRFPAKSSEIRLIVEHQNPSRESRLELLQKYRMQHDATSIRVRIISSEKPPKNPGRQN